MIGTLPEELKINWPQHVSTLTHAYNCTRNNATGFSPYLLMYGRQPLLPIDIEFGVFYSRCHRGGYPKICADAEASTGVGI